MPIEESGNIILLTYAYQHRSSSSDLTPTYVSILEQYANYFEING